MKLFLYNQILVHDNKILQMNIWKRMYLNRRERYEDMIDHRSYAHNVSSCEIIAEVMGSNPVQA